MNPQLNPSRLFAAGMAGIIGITAAAVDYPKISKNSLDLILPQAIYVVPGHEINVYFDNIIFVPNVKNYVFRIECEKGRQDELRWRWTPNKDETGSYPWKITISDGSGKVLAQGETVVKCISEKVGKSKEMSIMMVGDSLTDHGIYPRELKKLLTASGIKVKTIGSNAGGGRPVRADGVLYEGYGGWAWNTFLTHWTDDKKHAYRAKSKFLRLENGKPVLDFKHYLEKHNDGNPPDMITIFLGINDIARLTDENRDEKFKKILKSADALLKEFHKVAPKAKILIALTPPPAATQTAFGNNYGTGINRWVYRTSQHKLVKAYIKHFGNREKENIFLVPLFLNIDCVNNYPEKLEPVNARNRKKVTTQTNGVHPARPGYYQIADSFFFRIKDVLNKN